MNKEVAYKPTDASQEALGHVQGYHSRPVASTPAGRTSGSNGSAGPEGPAWLGARLREAGDKVQPLGFPPHNLNRRVIMDKNWCKRCNGRGVIPCPKCGGTGELPDGSDCDYCYPPEDYRDIEFDPMTLEYRASVPCPDCDRTGLEGEGHG